MDMLVVEGGRPLAGEVRTAGSKNAVLPILAAALLTDEPLKLPNAPRLADVRTMLEVLRELGCGAEQDPSGAIEIQSSAEPIPRAGWEHVRRMRGSVCVLGPLLTRCGLAEVSLPGGCVIGVRPIDVHLRGFEALGARVRIEGGKVVAEAPPGGLRGATMYLGTAFGSSVTGTANILMAATLARGRTVIQGAACEPEVVDLGECLQKMGARISGLGSPRIEVEGVARLGGATHHVVPDRIEAGTYLIAGALSGGRVKVSGCRPEHLSVLLERLREAGVPFEVGESWIETQHYDPRSPAHRPRSTDVTTLPYPGFPTDLQAQWMALMTLADGLSLVTERVYPDRFMHLAELARLGAEIRRQGETAIVRGTARLSGAPLTASDLRASAALVLAGLVADGQTEVHRVYHIDRGYERIEQRLESLGAAIRRMPDSDT
jgi:UDP-N-acetylglucosamine 1-carboxyvinyltransferase